MLQRNEGFFDFFYSRKYLYKIAAIHILKWTAANSVAQEKCNDYQVMLIPIAILALELSGMNSLLVLPRIWSIPIKKL